MTQNYEAAGAAENQPLQPSIEELIAASSLGTPEALALRARAVEYLGEEGLAALVDRILADIPDPGEEIPPQQ